MGRDLLGARSDRVEECAATRRTTLGSRHTVVAVVAAEIAGALVDNQ